MLASLFQNAVVNWKNWALIHKTGVLDTLAKSAPSAYLTALQNTPTSVGTRRSDGYFTGRPEGSSKTMNDITAIATSQILSGLSQTNVTGTAMCPIVYIEVFQP